MTNVIIQGTCTDSPCCVCRHCYNSLYKELYIHYKTFSAWHKHRDCIFPSAVDMQIDVVV